jgi:hypothetical protein
MEQRTILRKRTVAERSLTAATVYGAEKDPKTKDNSKAIPNSSFMEQRTIFRKKSRKGRSDDKMKM